MPKNSGIISIVISVVAVIISIVALVSKPQAQPQIQEQAQIQEQVQTQEQAQIQEQAQTQTQDAAKGQDTQYVLYLGTNDKDTNEPVFSPDEAKVHAEKILIDHFGGYTIQEANGGWADGDTLYQEYTLVIYLSDTTVDDVHEACDDLIKEFNQSSILIQANQTTTEFYDGGN
ncbi:MAG: hypothetical protein K6E91_08495 [Butyrivibrio sp.]|nr:hypothetical protein [Butyrivibrio sp.]